MPRGAAAPTSLLPPDSPALAALQERKSVFCPVSSWYVRQETELQRMMVLLTEDGGESGLNFEQFLSLVRSLALLRGRVCSTMEWGVRGRYSHTGKIQVQTN